MTSRVRRIAVAVLLLGALLAPRGVFDAPDAAAAAAQDGSDGWSAVVELRDVHGRYVAPVHGTFMPNGTILYTGLEKDTALEDNGLGASFVYSPEPIGAVLPSSIIVNSIVEPTEFSYEGTGGIAVNDSFVCFGHTLLADGRLFTAGGTRSFLNDDPGQLTDWHLGLPTQTIYDGQTWSRETDMVATGVADVPYRWYPTVTRLPDGRALVASGWDWVLPSFVPNLTTEVFDPATGTSTVASTYGETPEEILNVDYTHSFVLPDESASFDLLSFGQKGVPVLNSTADLSQWEVRDHNYRPGSSYADDKTNHGATTAMLPIRATDGDWGYSNGTVIVIGGGHMTTYVDQADVYDPVSDAWLASVDLGVNRHHGSSVLLPDGRVLLLSGHNMAGTPDTQQAQYIDPANNFAVTNGTASSGVTRGYHSVANLLPDGRVLIASGRGDSTATTLEKASLQYYEPDYMSATRPVITAAPDQLALGGLGAISTPTGGTPAELMLIGLSSMTHSIDMNQRAIQLDIAEVLSTEGEADDLVVFANPANAHVAPPGPYMLFLLDENRIPSEAKMVTIG